MMPQCLECMMIDGMHERWCPLRHGNSEPPAEGLPDSDEYGIVPS